MIIFKGVEGDCVDGKTVTKAVANARDKSVLDAVTVTVVVPFTTGAIKVPSSEMMPAVTDQAID